VAVHRHPPGEGRLSRINTGIGLQGGIINTRIKTAPFEVFDLKPESADVQAEVLRGLTASPKRLSPKFFYDERGSALFEAITALPEYYLTRTELSIFDAHMPSIARSVGPGTCLVEYGSGSSLKIRKVLEAVAPAAYVPVDISGEHLVSMAQRLQADFPDLAIYPVCADFTGTFALPPAVAGMPKVGFFPGSSIGNFEPAEARSLLARIRATVGVGGRLIIGVDLKKDVQVLEAAYDDAAGVTAAFNLNVLTHLADILDADLDPNRFAHRAVYNADIGAVQMFLDVKHTHAVTIGGTPIRFEAGESVHTENSFKYDPEDFLAMAERAGFSRVGAWTDERGWFGVFLLEADLKN
jgi:dimethylhistidine N-methyltransferase